jgi:hypothetical protein
MNQPRNFVLSVVGWLIGGFFWLGVTRNFHPTWTLAIVVTTTLIVAYATAAHVHHHHLIPTYWQAGRLKMHLICLTCTMVALTGIALAIIKVSYLYLFGPYPVNNWFIDFALDFFGMAVHLVLAMAAVALFKRFSR